MLHVDRPSTAATRRRCRLPTSSSGNPPWRRGIG